MKKLIKRFLILVAALMLAGLGLLIARTNPDGLTATEIENIVAQLNEAAAIGVPHDFLLNDEIRKANAPLLSKVESGTMLTSVESAEYRKLYQSILFDSQKFLGRFDAELTIIPDHAMSVSNNIGSNGIAGHHDHHDLSARKNFAELLQSLSQLETATSVFNRIRHANAAQKDLVDLISHLGVAPHAVSVPYELQATPWSDVELGNVFEAMMKAYKSAQQHDVNAPRYWQAVNEAMQNYSALILAVQNRIQQNTKPWQRRIAGNFNSTQTLAPPIDMNRVLRRK